MTHPTRAIAPLICRDYLKVEARNNKFGGVRYSEAAVSACFERATCMQLHERVVLDGLAITPFYAGHVLGAVMILLEHRSKSALYTGDFTMVAEHYLSAAKVPLALRPDVLITEATCCTTVRSSKRAKEQDFCRKIQETLENGGKVLIPIPSIGRGQEICLACDRHWERAGLSYPMYAISGGMAERGLNFFRLFASWSSDLVRKTEEPFNFNHVRMCDLEDVIDSDAPMVVFAGPSMLQAGVSLSLFRKWAPDRRNLVSFAGYCLPGTIGHFVQAKVQKINIDADTTIQVRCSVDYLSHSDHTDSRGILQLISQVVPRHVVLVHGSDKMMQVFQPIVKRRLGVPCSTPAQGECAEIFAGEAMAQEVLVSPDLVRSARSVPCPPAPPNPHLELTPSVCPPSAEFAGLFMQRKRAAGDANGALELVGKSARSASSAGMRVHTLRYRHEVTALASATFQKAWAELAHELRRAELPFRWDPAEPPWNRALQSGHQFSLTLLSNMQCCIRPSSNTGHWKATVDWTDEDERLCPAVAPFLDAFGEA